MRARLIDIAEAAHVSEATVSRVLAGKSGVNERTREKVLDVARSLGRNLDSALDDAHPLIGFVIPGLDNPIFPQFLDELESQAFDYGMDSLVAVNARGVEQEAHLMERLARAGATGIVVVSGQHAHDETSTDHYVKFAQRGIRLCLINGERAGVDASFISTDDTVAVKLALDHLRHLGHERVGLAVGDEHSFPVRGKVAAFERFWPHATGCIAYTDFSYAGGYQAALELIDQQCTAMVCGSDQMAIGAIAAVRDLGLKVPQHMSIVGYDDIQAAVLHSPAITTIRQPLNVIAKAALRAVAGGTGGSRQASRTEFKVRPELVVRGTTSPPEAR